MFYAFFFNDTATTEIYTLSLHDALPIYPDRRRAGRATPAAHRPAHRRPRRTARHLVTRTDRTQDRDRKSTRLNSSHANISYAVFCLKKIDTPNLQSLSLPR